METPAFIEVVENAAIAVCRSSDLGSLRLLGPCDTGPAHDPIAALLATGIALLVLCALFLVLSRPLFRKVYAVAIWVLYALSLWLVLWRFQPDYSRVRNAPLDSSYLKTEMRNSIEGW
jgi:hypothetical protein